MRFWWPRPIVSAVCRNLKDCQELVKWFDDKPNFCPDQPILLMIPGVDPPVVVAGCGWATVAELRDCCLEAWTVKRDRFKKLGEVLDFDSLRERHGDIPRDKKVEAMQYAVQDRIDRHKASPRTDPWKQFHYPNPTHKVKFPEQPAQDWKGESE